jgi:hypothetical protein
MNILIITNPIRIDLYNYLKTDKDNFYEVLWFENIKEFEKTETKLDNLFINQHFWNDYSTPKKLLSTIRPERIIFTEIIDQREIALIVAANYLNITTFYLEHGSAGDKETAIKRQYSSFADKMIRLKRVFLKSLFTSFFNVIRVKFFYYSNIIRFNSFQLFYNYCKLPFLMLWHLPNKALSLCVFRERVPKYSIVFNELNFEEYQLYTGISKAEALFTGLPFFDSYYQSNLITDNHIVYIEHPMLESNLLEWNKQHHKKIAEALLNFAKKNKVKLYVKLHPISDMSLWDPYKNISPFFEIIQFGDYMKLYLSSKLIIGYSSSLITGFLCSKKNIVNIGWHPTPQIFGVNFSDYNICHQSLNVEDLESSFDYWINHNLTELNKNDYCNFISLFNNPFDGKATERVINCFKYV